MIKFPLFQFGVAAMASFLTLMPISSMAADAPPATPALVSDKDLSENKTKAKEAWATDQKKLGAKEFAEMEKEYQEINTNYKSPQVKDLLTKFIEKWKTGNRVGCATLYLAQKSSGETRETLLKKCVGEFSGAFYLDGTQVGGLGRLFLAGYYKQTNKPDEMKKLVAELKKDFSGAQDHGRRSVVQMLGDLEK